LIYIGIFDERLPAGRSCYWDTKSVRITNIGLDFILFSLNLFFILET